MASPLAEPLSYIPLVHIANVILNLWTDVSNYGPWGSISNWLRAEYFSKDCKLKRWTYRTYRYLDIDPRTIALLGIQCLRKPVSNNISMDMLLMNRGFTVLNWTCRSGVVEKKIGFLDVSKISVAQSWRGLPSNNKIFEGCHTEFCVVDFYICLRTKALFRILTHPDISEYLIGSN